MALIHPFYKRAFGFAIYLSCFCFTDLIALNPWFFCDPAKYNCILITGMACADSIGDDDDDGLTNDLEGLLGTESQNADTDTDGIIDGGDPSVLAAAVLKLPPYVFKDSGIGLRTAMIEQLLIAERFFLAGKIEEGLKTLEHLKTKVDGCPPKAGPDDWIVECEQNEWVRFLVDTMIENHFSYRVDTTAVPATDTIPGLSGGPPRTISAAIGPDGQSEEFIVDEVIIKPTNQSDLNEFLSKYNGVVLRDGVVLRVDSEPPPDGLPESFGWYLIKIDPKLSELEDFAANMEYAGLRGNWTFSSEAAARLIALVARQQDQQAGANLVLRLDQDSTSWEHPLGGEHYIDWTKWWWMTEDDNPETPEIDGLSIGVARAWDYLKYKGYPPAGPYRPVRVAILDEGFDLDETTGIPNNGNLDYHYLGEKPLQMDWADYDMTAGGAAESFPDSYAWHGQLSFGACCAYPRNLYGAAGTSGGEVRPILIRVSTDLYAVSSAVYSAIANNADVINMSLSWSCSSFCNAFGNGNILQAAVGTARNHGVIVVASAGNNETNISNADQYPCELPGVICVGAIDENGNAQDYSNWGSVVDMWAPAGIKSTITRDSANSDPDDIGEDELFTFGGTSCSSPYLAGITAMMKMLDRSIFYTEVQDIMQWTSNPSEDPKVSTGYIDAFRALEAVAPNQPPEVKISEPVNAGEIPYQNIYFKASINDPDLALGPYTKQFPNSVVFYFWENNIRYALCSAQGAGTSLGCSIKGLSLGKYTIYAEATDAFEARSISDPVEITIINRPPTAKITYPLNASSFSTSQRINLRGYVHDPDEILYNLVWTIDGTETLGVGASIWVYLPVGQHVITVSATDTMGVTSSDTIILNVYEGAGFPTAQIIQPEEFSQFLPDTSITFVGRAIDPEDGELDGSTFVWTSDQDDFLGTGKSISTKLKGDQDALIKHWITLEVTDDDGHKAYHSIMIYVGVIG